MRSRCLPSVLPKRASRRGKIEHQQAESGEGEAHQGAGAQRRGCRRAEQPPIEEEHQADRRQRQRQQQTAIAQEGDHPLPEAGVADLALGVEGAGDLLGGAQVLNGLRERLAARLGLGEVGAEVGLQAIGVGRRNEQVALHLGEVAVDGRHVSSLAGGPGSSTVSMTAAKLRQAAVSSSTRALPASVGR